MKPVVKITVFIQNLYFGAKLERIRGDGVQERGRTQTKLVESMTGKSGSIEMKAGKG